MAYTTTRGERADRSRVMRAFLAAAAVATFGLLSVSAVAQVKAPAKSQLKAPAKPAASATDNQADQLNEQWLKEHGNGAAAAGKGEDERVSSVPSMVAIPGAGARTIVSGSVRLVNAKAAAGFLPGGANQAALKPLSDAFAGFSTGAPKVEMLEGRTADGSSRLLYAGIGEGKTKKSYWWFTPLDQPEGWFDETGKRLGGTVLADPKPESRISSPFGTRRYYGRSSGGGFHNGIDYEGKVGEPILAAADGVINHQDWYFQYGRTVKISHADNFETLYAHMSRFETSVAPTSAARSVVRFWLQAITFIPKALPICATAPPTLPRPRTPSVRPAMSSPTNCCHPPPRSDVFSATRLRALPRISAQVSSIVGAEV